MRTLQRHNTVPEKELHGLSPHFHIHVSLKDFPREQGWHPSLPHAAATLKDGALASPETERTGPLPTQQNDLDLTWDQDLDRSFANEKKDDDPDLIPDHDLKPGLASSLPPPCPPLPDDCGFRASLFRLCPICFKKWYCYRDAACLYCKRDPANNKQRLSDIMTYRANIDYEFMMCETEEENQ